MRMKKIIKNVIIEKGASDILGRLPVLTITEKITDIPLLLNFNNRHIIGSADVYRDGEVLRADLTIKQWEEKYWKYYPAIGGQILERNKDRNITKFNITECSIMPGRNTDKTIPNLKQYK